MKTILSIVFSAALACILCFGCSRKNTAFMNEQAMKAEFRRTTALVESIKAAEELFEGAEEEQSGFEEHAERPPEDHPPAH